MECLSVPIEFRNSPLPCSGSSLNRRMLHSTCATGSKPQLVHRSSRVLVWRVSYAFERRCWSLPYCRSILARRFIAVSSARALRAQSDSVRCLSRNVFSVTGHPAFSGDWAFASFSDDGHLIAVLEPYFVTFFGQESP